MAVIKSTDNFLRKLSFADKYTIVKYDNELCHFSKKLAEPYEKFSEDPHFGDVKFLVIHSNENPVARNEVEMKKMPFLSIYTQGILLDCGCVKSEKGILRFLTKLKSK
jgi:thioredoxin family protein